MQSNVFCTITGLIILFHYRVGRQDIGPQICNSSVFLSVLLRVSKGQET